MNTGKTSKWLKTLKKNNDSYFCFQSLSLLQASFTYAKIWQFSYSDDDKMKTITPYITIVYSSTKITSGYLVSCSAPSSSRETWTPWQSTTPLDVYTITKGITLTVTFSSQSRGWRLDTYQGKSLFSGTKPRGNGRYLCHVDRSTISWPEHYIPWLDDPYPYWGRACAVAIII